MLADPWRWPKAERGSFPVSYVISYGWRQTALYTPVVRRKCCIATIRFGKRARGFYGVAAFRNEDDEPAFRIGLGFVELDAYFLGFDRSEDDDA